MRTEYQLPKLKGGRNSYAKVLKKQVPVRTRKHEEVLKPLMKNAEWRRLCSAITRDSVRVSVPRVFLPMLTLFFHHVSDAMAGDDRPDHGLAMIRKGRERYRSSFYLLYSKLRRAEKRMSESRRRKAFRLFHRYQELSEKRSRF